MQYWGWVLFRNEYTRTSDHGGWFARRVEGINTTFVDKDAFSEVPREEICARIAYEETKVQFYPWDKRTYNERLYDYLDPSYLELIDIKKEIRTSDLARPSFDPQEHKRAWDAYYKALKKKFSRTQREYDAGMHRITWRDLFYELMEKKPTTDILPPIGEREELRRDRIITPRNTEFYRPYSTLGMDPDETFYVRNQGINSYNIQVGNKRLALGLGHGVRGYKHSETLVKEHFPQLNVREWGVYIYPESKDLEYYHDPFGALATSDSLGSEYKIYIPKCLTTSKRKLLEERKDFYGRELTIEEWIEFGQLKPCDQFFMSLTRRLWKDDSYTKDVTLKALRQYPGIGMALHDTIEVDTAIMKYLYLWARYYKKKMKHKGAKVIHSYESMAPKTYAVPDDPIELFELEEETEDEDSLLQDGEFFEEIEESTDLSFTETAEDYIDDWD